MFSALPTDEAPVTTTRAGTHEQPAPRARAQGHVGSHPTPTRLPSSHLIRQHSRHRGVFQQRDGVFCIRWPCDR